MVVHVSQDNIKLKIKEVEMELFGDKLWQTKQNRPLEEVTIKDRKKGFYPVGTATIKTNQEKRQILNRKGYFLKTHETSDAEAWPVFRKGDNVPVELPKIEVKE